MTLKSYANGGETGSFDFSQELSNHFVEWVPIEIQAQSSSSGSGWVRLIATLPNGDSLPTDWQCVDNAALNSTFVHFKSFGTLQVADLRVKADSTPAEYIEVPGGVFSMGHSADSSAAYYPQHRVYVPTFNMMRTEVTVEMYQACVQDNACTAPTFNDDTGVTLLNYPDPARLQHPINGLTPSEIAEFINWKNIQSNDGYTYQLPSEAQWAYAARFRSVGEADRWWPWSNTSDSSESPDCQTATYARTGLDGAPCPSNGLNWSDVDHPQGTEPVCRYPRGNHVDLGFCDLAGNVRELVLDDWHENYTDAPLDGSAWCGENGCEADVARPTRGGSFKGNSNETKGFYRQRLGANREAAELMTLGFRLVRVQSMSTSCDMPDDCPDGQCCEDRCLPNGSAGTAVG